MDPHQPWSPTAHRLKKCRSQFSSCVVTKRSPARGSSMARTSASAHQFNRRGSHHDCADAPRTCSLLLYILAEKNFAGMRAALSADATAALYQSFFQLGFPFASSKYNKQSGWTTVGL